MDYSPLATLLLIIACIAFGLWNRARRQILLQQGWMYRLWLRWKHPEYYYADKIIKTVYPDNTPYQLAKIGRNQHDDKEKWQFVYGEVEPESFKNILTAASPKTAEVFYDLGSGAGKAVLLAALLIDFKAVKGIELLSELVDYAKSRVPTFNATVKRYLPHYRSDFPIEFIEADFTHLNLENADIIFLNATCFEGALWEQLLDKFMQLKVGARIILVSKALDLPDFQLIYHQMQLMSWGYASIRIYQRLEEDTTLS